MGSLVACGTEGRGPAHHTFCAWPALCHLPTPTGPGVSSAQTPLAILKVPTVARFPPQIREISLQLCTASCRS